MQRRTNGRNACAIWILRGDEMQRRLTWLGLPFLALLVGLAPVAAQAQVNELPPAGAPQTQKPKQKQSTPPKSQGSAGPKHLDSELLNQGDYVWEYGYPGDCCPTQCCPTECCDDGCCPGLFVFGAGYLALRREYDNAPLFDDGCCTTLVTDNDLDCGYKSGFEVFGRVAIGALCAGGCGSSCCDTSCCDSCCDTDSCCSTGGGGGLAGCLEGLWAEVRYWQVDSFDCDLATNFFNSEQFFSYAARIYNTEINLLTGGDSWYRFLGGFRYIRYEEDTTFTEVGLSDSARTDNDLWGLQLGTEIDLYRNNTFGPLAFRGFCKGGIFAANSGSQLASTFNASSANVRKDREAWLVEAGLIGGFQPCCWLSLDFGYRVLWLDGIALAGEQYATFADPSVVSGGVLLHGFSGGATLMW